MAIYLDNAATSFPKPEPVVKEMNRYLTEVGASAGRGAYRRALEADSLVYQARKSLGLLFNIKDNSRIVFTPNATESLNLALKGLLNDQAHVITTAMEHNAVWRPLKSLEKEKGIRITTIPCPEGCAFDPAALEKAIKPDTGLVVLTHASNVTGAIMPVEEAGQICRSKGVPLLVDVAQTAGIYPIDIIKLNIDLLAFTGHKGLLGPTGTGGLYISPGRDLKPLKEGGTGGESMLEHMPDHLPDRYEAGTLNIAGIAGLGAAVKYILDQDVNNIWEHERKLVEYGLQELERVPGITVYGPVEAAKRVGVISFNLDGLAPEDAAYALDEGYGIMVRSGLHCSPQGHRSIGTEERGTVRVGLSYFNRFEDIDRLVEALIEIVSL